MHSGLTFGDALLFMHFLARHNNSFPQSRMETEAGLQNPPGFQGKSVREHGIQIILVATELPKFRCDYVDKIQDSNPGQRICETLGSNVSSLVLCTLVLKINDSSGELFGDGSGVNSMSTRKVHQLH